MCIKSQLAIDIYYLNISVNRRILPDYTDYNCDIYT